MILTYLKFVFPSSHLLPPFSTSYHLYPPHHILSPLNSLPITYIPLTSLHLSPPHHTLTPHHFPLITRSHPLITRSHPLTSPLTSQVTTLVNQDGGRSIGGGGKGRGSRSKKAHVLAAAVSTRNSTLTALLWLNVTCVLRNCKLQIILVINIFNGLQMRWSV